ncbi:MAG TPA: TolC family protein [Candidatus Eisenbacteria bacterium]|nr:TolC family protein [Candidatus Eisenbacteria bacterium]
MRRLPLVFRFAFLLVAFLPSAAFAHTQARGAGPAFAASADSTLDSLYAASTLEIGRLERAVIARNPTLAARHAAWDAMEARAGVRGGWDDPMIEGTVAPGSLGSSTVDAAYRVEISQTVALFGGRGLEKSAGLADARASGYEFRAARLDLIAEARRLYYRYYLIDRAAGTNRELIDLVEEIRRVAVQKYAAGLVGQTDALQAEVELAMLDHERIGLSRDRRVVEARLRALLHDRSGRPVPLPPAELPEAEHFGHAATTSGDQALRTAYASRPELLGVDATIQAREMSLKAANRAGLPELTLHAGYDRFMIEEPWRPQVGLGFTIPLWGTRRGASADEARAELTRALAEREAVRDSVLAQVEAAQARVQESEHELDIMKNRVIPATERALASVRTAYEANRTDFLTLLSAERDLARARLERYRTEVAHHEAMTDLDRALGQKPVWLPEEDLR